MTLKLDFFTSAANTVLCGGSVLSVMGTVSDYVAWVMMWMAASVLSVSLCLRDAYVGCNV